MDESAECDLPATLQHGLDVMGVPALLYISHSQGTVITHVLTLREALSFGILIYRFLNQACAHVDLMHGTNTNGEISWRDPLEHYRVASHQKRSFSSLITNTVSSHFSSRLAVRHTGCLQNS